MPGTRANGLCAARLFSGALMTRATTRVTTTLTIGLRGAALATVLLASAMLLASCHGGPGITVTLNPSSPPSLDAGGTESFVAILGNDTKNKGVTWVLEINGAACTNSSNTTNCGTLSNVTPFSVTYTAPNVSAALSITLEAKANSQPGVTTTATINIVLDPMFSTTTLPNGANGAPYNQTITVTDGVTPYLFKYTGNLPPGLSLNSATGAIVGTPTAPAVGHSSVPYSFTVTVTDNGGAPPLSEPLTIVVTPPTVLTFATTSIPQATLNQPYVASVAVHGGVPPYTFSATGLPSPLAMNAANGQITGTLPLTAATGSYPLQVQVEDSSQNPQQQASGTVGLAVVAPSTLSITTQSLPNGVTGTAYSGGTLQATGGIAPYTWSLVQSQLPSGLLLSSQNNGTGTISGFPVLAGLSTFTVQVQDSEATPVVRTATFSIDITAGASNNALLSGQYSFLFKGFDSGGAVALVGTVTLDGNGNVTTGQEDSSRGSGIDTGITLTGTYSIGSDGRGTMQVSAADPRNPSNTIVANYQLALQSNGNVKFFENNSVSASTDVVGTHGEGILKPVVGPFAASSFSGNYVFEFSGVDFSNAAEAFAGSLNANGAGVLSSGASDLNDAGTTNTGSATFVFAPPSKSQVTLNFDFYFVTASDIFFVEVDTAGTVFTNPPRLSGEMILQQPGVAFGTSALSGVSVATGEGLDGANATVFAGLLTSTACDGATAVSLSYDQNDAGTLSAPVFGGTCSITSNGRVSFNGLGSRASVAYLTGLGSGFLLGSDAGVTTGMLEQQTPGSYSVGSFVGEFAVGTAFPIDKQAPNISGQVNSTGGGSLNTGSTLDEFAAPTPSLTEGKATLDQSITGNINALATNGRGTLLLSGSTFVGLPTNVIFYVVSPTSIRWMTADTATATQHPQLILLDH
jgi:Putative Ig domain